MRSKRVAIRCGIALAILVAVFTVLAAGPATCSALTVEAFFGKEALPFAWVTGIFPDGDDVWVATKGGTRIYSLSGKSWREPPAEMAGKVVTGVARFGGSLYVGTEAGLNVAGPKTWTLLRRISGAEASNAFFVSSGDALWLAARAMTGGLLRYDGAAWSLLSRGPGTGVMNNIATLAFWKGQLWAGTTNNGIVLLKSGSWEVLGPEDGLPGLRVTALAGTDEGIYAGTPNGLGFFDGSRWRSYRVSDGLPSNKISALEVYKDGIIIGMFDRGVALLKGRAFQAVGVKEGLSDNRVESLAAVGDVLWVGTVNGLSLVRFP